MFYSDTILSRKGPLATVWLACHWDARKLTRPVILSTNLLALLASLEQLPPASLRLKGQLLLGLVRIYDRKIRYLLDDLLGFKDQIRLTELDATARRTQSQAQNSDELGSSSHLESGSTHKRARLDLITFPAVGTTDPSLALALLENKIAMSPNPHQRSQTMAQSPISMSHAMMHQNALNAFEPDMEALGWPSEWDIHYDDLLRPEQPRRDMEQATLGMRAAEEDIEVPRRAPTLDPLDMIAEPPYSPAKSVVAVDEPRTSLPLPVGQDALPDHEMDPNLLPLAASDMAATMMMLEDDAFMASLDEAGAELDTEKRVRDSLGNENELDLMSDTSRRTSLRLAAAASTHPMARNALPIVQSAGVKKTPVAHTAKPRSTRLAVDAWIEIPGAMIQSQLKDTSDITKSLNASLELELEGNSLLLAGNVNGIDENDMDDDHHHIMRALMSGNKKPLSRKRAAPEEPMDDNHEQLDGFEPQLLDPVEAADVAHGDAPTESGPWEDWATAGAAAEEGPDSHFSHELALPLLSSPTRAASLQTVHPDGSNHAAAAAVDELMHAQPATAATRVPDLMQLLAKETEAHVSFSNLVATTAKATAMKKDKRMASALFFQVLTNCSRGHIKVEQQVPFGDVCLIKVLPLA